MSKSRQLRTEIEDVIYAHGIGPMSSSEIADDIVKNVMSRYLIVTHKQADHIIEAAEGLYEGEI